MLRSTRLPLLPLATAFAATVVIVGCSDSGPPAVGRIGSVPGSSVPSMATAGADVFLRLVVEDESGSAMEGVFVELEVASGGGRVRPDTLTTGVDGQVHATWSLGTGAGEQTLRVTARGTSEVIAIRAEPGDPARMEVLSGADVMGTVGEPLSSRVRVRVSDRYRNPVPEWEVTFEAQDAGDGTVSEQEVTTDDGGVAATDWTLGTEAGTQRLYARTRGLGLTEIRARVQAGPPTVLERVSGDRQSIRVGQPLAEPLVVRVRDEFGNPAPGAAVTFTPGEGAGSASPAVTATDSEGLARTSWTLGITVRAWTLEAAAEGVGEAVVFEAQSLPGPAASMEAVSGDGQEGYAGAPLSRPVEVRVRDEYGNAVPFVAVRFEGVEGGGSAAPAHVTADGEGRAATTWILGPALGANRLEARSGEAPPVGFSAVAASYPPADVRVVAGDGQTGRVASPLPQAVVARVLDRDGNPVEGAAVAVLVTSGGGSVAPAELATDGGGEVRAAWTLGTEAGAQTLELRVEQVEAPTVVSATATPGPAVRLAAAAGDGQSAPVGRALADPVVARAEDAYGNGVPGVDVSFAVIAGGGSVSPGAGTTDAGGRVSAAWTLGTQAGENGLEASAGGLGSVGFRATATVAPPAAVEIVAGDGQTGRVAAELSEPLEVRVLDADGQPIEGVSVELVPSGSGAAALPAVASTDADGVARTRWRLGTGAGEQTLEARVDGVDAPAVFSATATPGPPAVLATLSGDGQKGVPDRELPEPFVVDVTDEYQNPVEGVSVGWVVVGGNGTLSTNSSVTDARGRAAALYTTGTTFGEERVRASAEGLSPAEFTVLVGNNLSFAGLYVTQSAQPFDASSPLVADRDGVLRIFVRAGAANTFRPTVRVRLYRNGSLLETHTLEAPEGSVRTTVTESTLAASWNLALPGSLIRPGLAIQAEIDPDNEIGEVNELDNVFPAGGGARLQDVRVLPPFRARMIPIDVSGQVGDVNEGNMRSYMTAVFAMMPMPDYDVDMGEVYTANVNAGGSVDWGEVIGDVLALQRAGGTDRYYYGVIHQGSGAPFCGLGYIGLPTALGVDICGAGTAAHEWGHNWGRLHAPCGGVGGPDPDYPYPNASIGVWGLDVATGELRDPARWKDLMSYCGPEWVSDYTYEGVLDFREEEAAGAAAQRTSVEPALILWGRITPEGPVLEPSFTAVTRPALPQREGPYTVRALAADGAELLTLRFDGARVDHPEWTDQRAFAFAVPLSRLPMDRLDRLVLEVPGRAPVVRTRGVAPGEGGAEAAVRPSGPGRVRVTWNEAAAPLVVVRDPATGAILSLARGGSVVVRTDAPELELELAGGVRSVRTRVRVR